MRKGVEWRVADREVGRGWRTKARMRLVEGTLEKNR